VSVRVHALVPLSAAALSLAVTAACTAPQGAPPAPPQTAAPQVGAPAVPAAGAGLEVVPAVAAQVEPSVVTILTGTGNGSGVVFTDDGLVVTNEHVVRGATTVQVAFADGQRVTGTVRATDPVTDVALVQADRQGVPPARFQPELPAVGSLAIVIGSPLGFENSVTVGVISGLHREIPGSAAQGQSLVDLIQTDAAISPGNSGGAVVNAAGEVVGLSEAYIPPQAGAVSIGFAIPAATVLDVVDQLRRTGRASHAFAGLAPAPITPAIAAQLGLPSTEGAIVAGVVPGGPAQTAGLRPGDVITAVDGQPVRTPEDFLAALRRYDPGDTLTLTVRGPDGSRRDVPLTVTDRPAISE
jgi:serine protease DegQ